MHYVHMNTKYKSVSDAKEYKDGLAVLGTLFQVSSSFFKKSSIALSMLFWQIEKKFAISYDVLQ